MALTSAELNQVIAELDAGLRGAVVQKAYVPEATLALLELRTPGVSELLVLSSHHQTGRLAIADTRPPSPPNALSFQQVLRKELTGARLGHIVAVAPLTARLDFERPGRPLHLYLELGGALALCTERDIVLGLSVRREGLSVGRPYAPPRANPPHPATSGAGSPNAPHSSRLLQAPPARGESAGLPTVERWPLARAAERLMQTGAQTLDGTAQERATAAAIKKLERTLEKVRADADRAGVVEQYRRDGELISHNLHAIARGAASVTLTEYPADSVPRQRVVKLDPKKSPKAYVEWLFHQAKRLERGVELSRQREAELSRKLAQLKSGEASAHTALQSVGSPNVGQGQQAKLPYREYLGWSGRRIWVGRGAKANDELTFKVAAPHHLWLHARGVQGAHVVVPLEKNEAAPQELLLDAAHLALHHSSLKGEDKGEVSYTLAKYVRKIKGAAGAVTYTHDKTFWLKVESGRLQRLLGGER